MRTNGEGIPVVALDIDGTLGDYHGHFLRFAQDWTGKQMPAPSQINPGERLHKFMGISLREYRECKLAYRQGGLKRSMPAYEGAGELTSRIKALGAEVWICTTRPYLRLDNIDPDTREWLRRNQIRYDAVLFGENKYAELKRQAGKRVGAVFEDLPELCERSAGYGFSTWIRDQPYNRHYVETIPVFGRVESCKEMYGIIADNIGYWKAASR
jgi:5' nucleotidase, deoxy (Pyrimidine), cytosolic type C protein (NT5C)